MKSGPGRFCCKSLFVLVIKNFSGFRRDFSAKMWGTSSPNDKLADDLGNAIEVTRISGRRSDFFTTEKLAPDNLGLLQQYLQEAVTNRSSIRSATTRPSRLSRPLSRRFRGLQCGRDVVSGTVNVTVCLHSAHPSNKWCSALTNSAADPPR